MAVVALTFDLDDTLWPVKPALIRAEKATSDWLAANAPSILDTFTLEDMLDVRMTLLEQKPALAYQISELRRQAMTQMAMKSGFSETEARNIAEEAFQVFLAHRQNVDCFPGVSKLLEELANSYVIGAISNGNADIFKTELGGYFSFCVSAESVGASKPDAKIFAHALEQVQSATNNSCSAAEIIHIGDDYHSDIAGGKDFGCQTAGDQVK